MDNPDIVVVGGGIAGGAMATVLARAGLDVLMLEITKEYRDIVRGEVIVPWGVAEAKTLGLYELYEAQGAHLVERMVNYGQDTPREVAEATAMQFAGALPDVKGGLAFGHPQACALLCDAAEKAGAGILRGVRHVRVASGTPPTVSFEHDGTSIELKPRLVIGADGRHGQTRKQAGIVIREDPVHHWMFGLLVRDVEDWPAEKGSVATVGNVAAFNFPQGRGCSRLYLCVPLEDRALYSGPDGARAFLDAYRMECVPGSDIIAQGSPAGDIFGYPNSDTWADEPFAPGVVLIGDAAGRNDPIIGQGLSIAMRDVRIMRDILGSARDWSVGAFRPYAEERAERMRRLRTVGRVFAAREAAFGPEGREFRKRSNAVLRERPELGMLFGAITLGPERIPPAAFSDEAVSAILPN